MAQQLGKTELAEEFYTKSQTYRQYFDPEREFMREKLFKGK